MGRLDIARQNAMPVIAKLGPPGFDESDLPGFASPRDAEATVRLGRGVVAATGCQRDAAFEELEKAYHLAPTNVRVCFFYGEALLDVGRFAEAEPYFKAVAERSRGYLAEISQSCLGHVQWLLISHFKPAVREAQPHSTPP